MQRAMLVTASVSVSGDRRSPRRRRRGREEARRQSKETDASLGTGRDQTQTGLTQAGEGSAPPPPSRRDSRRDSRVSASQSAVPSLHGEPVDGFGTPAVSPTHSAGSPAGVMRKQELPPAAGSRVVVPQALAQLLPDVNGDKVCRALRSVGASEEDWSMGLDEFRTLFACVFKRTPESIHPDTKAWHQTEDLFMDIDKSGDGEVDLEELITYLAKPMQPIPRPQTVLQWVWVFVAPIGRKIYDPRVDPKDRWIMWAVFSYRVLSQVAVAIFLIVIFIESLPSMQNNADGSDPGTSGTFVLESFSVIFATLELTALLLSHPEGPVGKILSCGLRKNDAGKDVYAGTGYDQWYCGMELEGEAFGNGQCGPFDGLACESCRSYQTNIGPPHRPLYINKEFWVDLASVVPYYVNLWERAAQPWKAVSAVRFARMMRLLRVVRTLRIVFDSSGYVEGLPKLVTALQRSFYSLLWLGLLIFIIASISSTFMYFAERQESHFDDARQQWVRDADSLIGDAGERIPYQSIPETMWWALVTVSTVGYGDLFPVTKWGKVIGGATILTGLVIVVFPITIIGSVFQTLHEEQQQRDEKVALCRNFYSKTRAWLAEGGGAQAGSMTPSRRHAASPGAGPSSVLRGHSPGGTSCDRRELSHDVAREVATLIAASEQRVLHRLSAVAQESRDGVQRLSHELAKIQAALLPHGCMPYPSLKTPADPSSAHLTLNIGGAAAPQRHQLDNGAAAGAGDAPAHGRSARFDLLSETRHDTTEMLVSRDNTQVKESPQGERAGHEAKQPATMPDMGLEN